jgi:carboxylesterase type B
VFPLALSSLQFRATDADKSSHMQKHRPQCPQNHVDAGHLLRIPEILDEGEEEVKQDEFECLNLNVSVPARTTSTKDLLPVLIWIHGETLPTSQFVV